MMTARLKEAAVTVHGELHGIDGSFAGVSTDTRSLRSGELFVALQGPNFDGNQFVGQAAAKDAAGAVVTARCDTTLPQIEVDDSLQALGQLASHWRRQMQAKVVGLTGSNGKTTLKEMIASCLSRRAATLATEGNLNNEIGVPLMLLRLSPEHRYAVIEMGANHAGEIAYLTECAAPAVVAITNAGAAHLEGFGSIAGVARAKGEILQGRERPEVAVLNADDEYFDFWCSLVGDVPVLSFGTSGSASVRAFNINESAGLAFDLALPDAEIHVELPLSGRHNAVNAAAAAAIAVALDLPPEDIRLGLGSVRPVAGRIVRRAGARGTRLFDDSYNANPDSVRAAAAFLASRDGRSWLVLGDMAELGTDATRLHREAGAAARECGVERLYALGQHTPSAVEAFGEGGAHFGTIDQLIAAILSDLQAIPPQNILVKGSRSMRMERVVDALRRPDRNGEAA